MIIVPAIYPENFEEIVDKIYLIGDLSNLVQIDLCDGSYGLRTSWSPTGREIFPSKYNYEFDLILTSWREYVVKAYQLGVKRVVIHIDEFTDDDYEELFKMITRYGMTLGFTVSNDVTVDILINAVHKVEKSGIFSSTDKLFIQVNGVRNLAENNHPFDERVLHRIRVLKNFFPPLIVQVSGRMNPETARLVSLAGADRLVVGSYIFGHSDINAAIESIKTAISDEEVVQKDKDNGATLETEQIMAADIPGLVYDKQ